MRKIFLFVCLASLTMNASADSVTREWLATYANSLTGLKKGELKTAIYKLCQPSKVLGYGSGSSSTWSGFVKTDRIGTTLECRNRYSTDRFYFSSATQTSAISGMNIEHSFPKSWWGGTKNNAYKDLYNLYPSSSDDNSAKSNYPMGKVTNASILDDYEKVGTGDAGGTTIRLCEPNDEWKGDFCRSYFYMATIYQNLTWTGSGSSTTGGGLQSLENDTWPTLKEWAYTLYLEWTKTDRVTDIEVDRNNAVYAIQGNRNLFIDYPELAEYVWGDSIDVAFNPKSSLTSASDDDRFETYQAGNYETGQSGTDTGDLTQVAQAPSLTAACSFVESQEVTITNNEDGATVYYTTDGTTPTTSSTSFTDTSKTLTLTATTTVKAMAVIDGKTNSNVTSVTYTRTSSSSIANTAETAYTVAEASNLIAAGNDLDQKVYVKGIISEIGSLDSNYGELTYYISDDGTTDDQFMIYDGYGLNQAKFTSASDIEVGATVIVYGQLKSYNGTDEMKYGSYIVKYTAPSSGGDSGDTGGDTGGDTSDTKKASSIIIVLKAKVGQTDFKGFTFSSDSDGTATYSSSDTNVATVDATTGAVTIVGAGTVTITYTIAGSDAYNAASASYGIVVE